MRRLSLIVLLFFIRFSVQAQEGGTSTCDLTTDFCANSLSLKNGTHPVAVVKRYYYKIIPTIPPKPNNPTVDPNTGFQDVRYQLNYCPSGCPPPSQIPDPTSCENDPKNALYYYVYYPSDIDLVACPHPALIMFHSGAFSECSKAEQDDITNMCTEMASRGFVVFDVSYRVGVLTDATPIPGKTGSDGLKPKFQLVSAQQVLAIYRACQDARGAIRSIIQRQLDEGINNGINDLYRIDLNYVFVGGMSAGSAIAMTATYYKTQGKYNSTFPNVSSALGSIDPDLYYASPTALGTLDYFQYIKGVFNMWGSMFVPKTNYDNGTLAAFLGITSTSPPIISFAGVQDPVFDIHKQDIYFSKNVLLPPKEICQSGYSVSVNFGKETHCLLASPYITPQPALSSSPPILYEYGIGSETIFHLLDDNSVFAELNLDCEMMHGLDNDDGCGSCSLSSTDYFHKLKNGSCVSCGYTSNFGTIANNQSLTYKYIAGRAATFFQAIISNTTSVVVHKKFVEQENDRYGCSAPDNPAIIMNNTCDNDTHP